MGLYLNQLPQTEVARLKAELAETLIANFCYPRFYDYRVSALRTRPVDRVKRQEVWQYLNAVDFNVWGRVDVDSPDFQRQVERLFIHFVQRNRSFFGEQGRKRMTDVRQLISGCSTSFVEGLRKHLSGQHGTPPFGSPRAVSSWLSTNVTGRTEASWEQILSSTMLLQQQLQEARGEVRPSAAPMPTTPPSQTPAARSGTVGSSSVPSRRPRPTRSTTSNGNGNGVPEEESVLWPAASNRPLKSFEEPLVAPPRPAAAQEDEAAQAQFVALPASNDAAPTLPLPLGKVEGAPTVFQPVPTEFSPLQTRARRGKAAELSPAAPFNAPPSSEPRGRQVSQPMPVSAAPSLSGTTPTPSQQVITPIVQAPVEATKQAEQNTAVSSDEDVVIFEQMRHQLIIWLRVEAVRAGLELNGQNTFQLVDSLRHQDGVDTARLQVVSTLLTMCDQIITSGHASLFDYKQAMMFYLMHTRRGH